MSRRIDIELTSLRGDDSWTWRAAGAREPKGVIESSLVPGGAKVGDELKVEAEFLLDGIEIIAVVPTKSTRKEPEVLEILGSGRDDGGVTTSLVPKRERGRGDRRDRDDEGGRGRGRARPDRGEARPRDGREKRRGPREAGDRDASREARGPRTSRPERPAPPAKPKPKRLRPQRVHRSAVLASLPQEQRPIAEQVLRGGLPAVRKAVEEQNVRNKTEGRPEIDPSPLLQLAETLLPGLKEAEWHDRADAALEGIADVDLRDLRSVVVAADSSARSEPTRSLAEQLRSAVADRVDQEHHAWLGEIAGALDADRTVRALRMSSRPPKAGAPLPPDLNTRLIEAATAALSEETGPQRWATVVDAVAFSPIRTAVTPSGIPATPSDELLETLKRLSTRVPEIAALFGIEPQKAARRSRKPRAGGGAGDARPARDARRRAAPAATEAVPQAEVSEAVPVAEVSEAAPVVEVSEAAPEVEVSEAAPVAEVSEAAPVAEVSEAVPEVEVSEAAPEAEVSEAAPVAEVSEAVPEVEVSEADLEVAPAVEVEAPTAHAEDPAG